jgi:hypothetical protein
MVDLVENLISIACQGPEAVITLCTSLVVVDRDMCRAQTMILASIASEPTRRELARHPDAMPGFMLMVGGKPVDVEQASPHARCAGRMVTAMSERDYDRALAYLDSFTEQHPTDLAKLMALLIGHVHMLMHPGTGHHEF